MKNLIYHPDAFHQVEQLPAAARMEFKRLIYLLGKSQFDQLKHCRSIDHIVDEAFEVRIPLAKNSFVFFYVRNDSLDIVFFAFTAELDNLRLSPRLVDQAQNDHIEVLNSLV